MSGRNEQRKLGTTRGSPRRSRTAKASRISRRAVKSRCAREWGGWGRLSDDGPGHYNPDPSEGPWGGGLPSLHGGALSSPRLPTQSGNIAVTTRCTKGGCKPAVMQRMSGADLSCGTSGKAPSDKPAFQPYWGKPAVRNDRGGSRKRRHHAKPDPRLDPTRLRGALSNERPYRDGIWTSGPTSGVSLWTSPVQASPLAEPSSNP